MCYHLETYALANTEYVFWQIRKFKMENIGGVHGAMAGWNSNKAFQKLVWLNQASIRRNTVDRLHCNPANLEEKFSVLQPQKFSKDHEIDLEDLPDEDPPKPPSSEEVSLMFTSYLVLATYSHDKLRSSSFPVLLRHCFMLVCYSTADIR